MIDIVIYIAAGLITLFIPGYYIRHERIKSRKASSTLAKAMERGLDEPVSLHPLIDPNTCIGTGACVKACPEDRVIGLIDNHGALINPARCIGHGLCAAACPVEAIQLVFGTENRGVDIPHVSGEFESNISGIYIAGELGGMGLIRNAVTQGRQAAENIARSLRGQRAPGGVADLVVVGAGPAGIAASLQAKREGLNAVTLDQDDLGGTILSYPRRKLVMTQPMELPLYGKISFREIHKEALLNIFTDVFTKTGLEVSAGERVEEVLREETGFTVVTGRRTLKTRRVLLAIGRRGSPRKLGVSGEKSAKVAYRLTEPEKFHHLNLLVVGGGDSAVEAALALSEQPGNKVAVSYRRERFFRLKEGNQRRIEAAAASGALAVYLNSRVLEIYPDSVMLEVEGRQLQIPNEQVFVMIGGELPAEFLTRVGIKFTRKFGEK